MNRRICINCQTTWRSLSDDELESPHNCPNCGDQLGPLGAARFDAEHDGRTR